MDWKKKLSSRKFWALVATFAASMLVLFGVGEADITKITALITAAGSAIAYIFAEGNVDAKSVKKDSE
jgi:hypothetical protein